MTDAITSHAELAAGRWRALSLAEQLAHVGSEVDRAIVAWEAHRPDRFEKALARALELFDLTARDDRWRGHRRREVLRAREEFCGVFFSEDVSSGAVRSLQRYFLHFAVLAGQPSPANPQGGESMTNPRIARRDPSELSGAPQCWVCLQLEDADRTRATQQLVAIVGVVEYAGCV